MQTITKPRVMQVFTSLCTLSPGLALSGVIAAAAMWLSAIPQVEALGFGALTLAIIFGILIGNTFYPHLAHTCALGVNQAKQKLLRLGIMLYGFRLTFQQIADIGISGIIIDVLILSSTFLLALWLGRKVFGLDKQTVMLIGAGSSICGAAAIMATEPVVRADANRVAVAIATVVLFGTLAIFIYPWLYQLNTHYQWMVFSQQNFGVYIGSTVHEVAQVVAAGRAISDETGNAAVITKMLRVMLLAPFLLILSGLLNRSALISKEKQKTSITIPWFALIFILIATVNSVALLPANIVHQLITLDTVLLAMAMAALGLTTHISAIRQAGFKPILLAASLFGWLLVAGAMINKVVMVWL